MGDILRKITELLENGANYEERRSTGTLIKCGWFDAIDDTSEGTRGRGKANKAKDKGAIQGGRDTDLDDQTKFLLFLNHNR